MLPRKRAHRGIRRLRSFPDTEKMPVLDFSFGISKTNFNIEFAYPRSHIFAIRFPGWRGGGMPILQNSAVAARRRHRRIQAWSFPKWFSDRTSKFIHSSIQKGSEKFLFFKLWDFLRKIKKTATIGIPFFSGRSGGRRRGVSK